MTVLTEEEEYSGATLDGRLTKISKFSNENVSWFMPLRPQSKVKILLSMLTSGFLYYIARYRDSSFRKKLLITIEKFQPEIIHYDIITISQYVGVTPIGVGSIASINDSYALTLQNALEQGNYTGIESIYRKIQLVFTRRYESRIYPRFDYIHVMTKIDANYLEMLNSKIKCRAIANGVDPRLFENVKFTKNNKNVVFVGNLVAENLIYLNKLLTVTWPVVRAANLQSKFYIVGRINDKVRELVSLYDGREGVIFRGYVENIVDAYKDCGIALAPVNKDCGILNKAIEAMAAGMAVIGFNKSFSGVEGGRVGEHYLTSENYVSMGEVAIELLRDPIRHAEIQENAYLLARENFSWESRADHIEKMYADALESAKADSKQYEFPAR
ncbi:MAG: glycosyltransferase [Nitrospira sp.]|nr:glycosyltransferase [Nitrospira sp.]